LPFNSIRAPKAARPPKVQGPSRSRPSQIIDFSSLELEDKNPFHGRVTHRRRWLLTTTFTGFAACAAIGLILSVTFGLNSFQGPTIASQQAANLWQRSVATVKTDRVAELASGSSRAALAKLMEEKPYKRISGEVSPSRRRLPQLSNSGLVGSLAPDYPGADEGAGDIRLASLPASAEITGSIPRHAAIGKPTVLPPTATGEESETIAGLPDSGLIREKIKLSPGDTLFQILTEQGTKRADAQQLIAELESLFPTRYLRQGQEIAVTYKTVSDELGRESKQPIRLAMAAGPDRQIVIRRNARGDYTGYDSLEAQQQLAQEGGFRKRAKIRESLYSAAKEQGIPEPIIIEMMRIHAYHVDFQREIRPGDTFEVFYEIDKTSKSRRRGIVLYSSLTLGGKTKGFYRYSTKDGIVDYFDENGQSATKFLIRTPVKAVRITSGFGMRRHPILGYTKMHTGVDFGAAYGTPVRAAGSGIIEKIGRVGAYGNYVRLRHVKGYKTAYAHMRGFASGLSVGDRVRQGQVIGYVGSTGRSTGPHLHYEILVNNKQVNPMKVRLPNGRKLEGNIREAFLNERTRIDNLRRTAPGTRIAGVAPEPVGRGGP